ncbi:MAG TPA: DUF1003 domain-containing protein [Planctomycetaceae bacterium]|mgnify:CR=1 FL=1|nr:DUF1003 domain-containing protein [Planctomycetaceae bacterium]
MTKPCSCLICGQARRHLVPATLVRTSVAELIRSDHPDWTDEAYICLDDLNMYRSQFVAKVLAEERGELTAAEAEVVRALKEHELISENTNTEIASATTIGDRLSDRLASFGGSWSFLIMFGTIMTVWILFNSIHVMQQPVDPFPFILLNLILSCLAAVQAPVIMMSQNRQETKDRMRAEHDYQVNIKAELEIRQLHSKLDMLLTHQWQRLLEIQQIQTDLMQQIVGHRNSNDSKPGTRSQ